MESESTRAGLDATRKLRSIEQGFARVSPLRSRGAGAGQSPQTPLPTTERAGSVQGPRTFGEREPSYPGKRRSTEPAARTRGAEWNEGGRTTRARARLAGRARTCDRGCCHGDPSAVSWRKGHEARRRDGRLTPAPGRERLTQGPILPGVARSHAAGVASTMPARKLGDEQYMGQ